MASRSHRPSKRSPLWLAPVVAALGACSSPAPLGRVHEDMVSLLDRAAPSGAFELALERNGVVRSMTVGVAVDDLPTRVREAALAAEPGAVLVGAERAYAGDERGWEVKLTQDGRAIELFLEDGGRVLETARELRRDEAPRSVLNAADAALPGGTFRDVTIRHRGRTTQYHVGKERGGARFEVVTSAEGKVQGVLRLLRSEIELPLER